MTIHKNDMQIINQLVKKIRSIINNYVIFFVPVILCLTLFEALLYYGVTKNILYLDIKLIIIFFLIMILFVDKQRNEWKLILSINKFVLIPTITFFFITLNYIDMRNYVGYVFSNYHIHPQNLLLSLIFLFSINELSKHHVGYMQVRRNIGITMLSMITGYALLSVCVNSMWIISSNYNNIIRSDLRSYDTRMEAVWGEFYPYIQFIKRNTTNEVSIAHPPQANPWQMEGNQLISRYFLYPRKLNSAMDDNFYQAINKSDWLMISNGTPRFYPADFEGYPMQPIYLKDIKIFKKEEILVEPISIKMYKSSKDSEITSLTDMKTISINSDKVDELTFLLLNNISPTMKYIEVRVKSNMPYTVSLYLLPNSGLGEKLESPSNITLDNDDTYTLTFDFTKSDSKLTQDSIYLKVTNAKPLPYLYKKGIARIIHEYPVQTKLVDFQYYESLGNYNYSINNYDEAKKAYIQAIRLKPDAAEALLGLYYLSKKDNNLNEAVQYAKTLSAMLPTEGKFNLGAYLLLTLKKGE